MVNNKRQSPMAYTLKYSTIVPSLFENNIYLTPPDIYQAGSNFQMDKYKITGVWDTGASNTAISEEIVKKLQLPTVSMSRVNTANGITVVTQHVIDLFLPNKVVIKNLLVTSARLTEPVQILIGMDVISKGDFSVSNFNNKTTVSFRIPSLGETDYVSLIKSQLPVKNQGIKTGRNDPCPCGSGKKYKNCCGKL